MVKKSEYNLLPSQTKFMIIQPPTYKDENKVYHDISVYYGGVTCKKGSAEFLSPTGWKRIDTLTKEDYLAVYHPETGKIKYEHPKEIFIYPADKWYEINSKFIHQINCPAHKVYTIKNGKPQFQTMEEFYNEHINSLHGHRGKFLTTFKYDGKPNNYTDDELRFIVAFQADGYQDNRYKNSKWNGGFHLKKRRKVARLLRLLRRLKYKFSYLKEKNTEYYRFKVNAKYTYKKFPEEFYSVLSSEQLEVIATEAPYWDGSIERTNYSYYSKYKENVDFIQYAAAASGMNANVSSRNRSHEILKQGRITNCTENKVKYSKYHLTPSLEAPTATEKEKNSKIKILEPEEGELKYCPSTSTKLWVCREFGKISITGNSGKTFIGSLRGLTYALTWAGCRGLVGAVSQDLLDNTTKRKYLEHMENIGLVEGVHWWFTDRQQQIVFKNGSIIRFKTLSDWRQFMSEEFTWIEFEEASFLDRIVFEKLITRLRQMKHSDWKGYYRSLFMHTNPQGKRGWINELFCTEQTKVKGYRFIRASTRENKHLGSEYVETLENLYSADQIKEMIEGYDVDNDNTVAFPDFDVEQNVSDDITFNPNYPLVLACDFNYNPMCWYLMQEIDGTWYVLQELIRENVTTGQMCEYIFPILISDYGIRKLTIMGDSHGRDKKTNGSDYAVMLSYLQNKGIDCTLLVQRSNPPIKDRLAVLRGYIKNAKGLRRLKIHSSCRKLIYNYNECKNNLVNGGLRIPTDKEIQADDSKRYLIHPIDATSYPIYYMTSLREIAGQQENIE